MKQRAVFVSFIIFCCFWFCTSTSLAYNNKKAKKLYKQAQKMVDIDSEIALTMIKKARSLARPGTRLHRKLTRLLKIYTKILKQKKTTPPSGVRYIPPRKPVKRLPPPIRVKGILPPGPCPEIQKVLALLEKNRLSTRPVLKLKQRLCDKKSDHSEKIFSLNVITLDKDMVSIPKCAIFVGKKRIGKTDGFGTYSGRIRARLGYQITIKVYGYGRRNSKTIQKTLRLIRTNKGLQPELLQVKAVLRRR